MKTLAIQAVTEPFCQDKDSINVASVDRVYYDGVSQIQERHPEIMEKDEVSTAALPTPLTTRSSKQIAVNTCGLCTRVTSPNAAADPPQISRPLNSNVFR